jgi:hypothetical protein
MSEGLAEIRPASRRRSWGAVRAVSQLARQHPLWALLLAGAAAGIIVLAIGGYFLGWGWTGFAGNTVWDWLSLLVTPVTIAVASLAFNAQQGQRSLEASEQQHRTTLQLEHARQQEAALDAYLEHMAHLLVDGHLKEAPPGDQVRAEARARTLATLQRVDQARKDIIHRFLSESGLTAGDDPVIDLRGASQEGSDLFAAASREEGAHA